MVATTATHESNIEATELHASSEWPSILDPSSQHQTVPSHLCHACLYVAALQKQTCSARVQRLPLHGEICMYIINPWGCVCVCSRATPTRPIIYTYTCIQAYDLCMFIRTHQMPALGCTPSMHAYENPSTCLYTCIMDVGTHEQVWLLGIIPPSIRYVSSVGSHVVSHSTPKTRIYTLWVSWCDGDL